MRRRELLTAPLLAVPLATRVRAAPAPVVLELFTSQSCSSCPPAEAVLGQLVREPGVIALAWHVDYWNSLGWTDRFASKACTDRQRNYAKRLSSEVFTPALVVNGAAMVVGSDAPAVRRAMAEVAQPPVAVTLRRTAGGVQAEPGTTGTSLTGTWVFYDPQDATDVGGGENGGRRLVEYRVVREVIPLPELAPVLTLPSVPDNRGVVLLIQNESWRIVGAGDLPPAERS